MAQEGTNEICSTASSAEDVNSEDGPYWRGDSGHGSEEVEEEGLEEEVGGEEGLEEEVGGEEEGLEEEVGVEEEVGGEEVWLEEEVLETTIVERMEQMKLRSGEERQEELDVERMSGSCHDRACLR